ncbi:MAG: 16S rRNA (adenine(1518)-N(6)/adenine(1519)-N(6))-dimethyltransferase RsmA [Hyphomicrobiales bacterium]|nr:16S rRNA (adenine(1518)-N(6)/adenine(1519)-N(6))-dimethyltransferase RsmA [Hyphomicrobiales bacterium]
MTDAPDNLPPLREVIRRLDLTARKSLSQNFILDLNLTRRIARSTGNLHGVTVIEVGPGPGGLTRALLLEGADRVIAIERDERCKPALEEIAAHWPGQLEILMGDALTTEYASLAVGAQRVRVIANLPYSIATPLFTGWLTAEPWPPWWEHMALMFQREVADRIVAPPGSKTYGRLSVLSQWRAAARIAFHLPAQAFTPPPKVSSSVVVLSPLAPPVGCRDSRALQALTAAAFGQRRKMLRSTLKATFADLDTVLKGAGINATDRAESVTVEQYAQLAAALEALTPQS